MHLAFSISSFNVLTQRPQKTENIFRAIKKTENVKDDNTLTGLPMALQSTNSTLLIGGWLYKLVCREYYMTKKFHSFKVDEKIDGRNNVVQSTLLRDCS